MGPQGLSHRAPVVMLTSLLSALPEATAVSKAGALSCLKAVFRLVAWSVPRCQSTGKPGGDPSLDGPGPQVVFPAGWPALRSTRPRCVSSPPSCWAGWTQVLRKIPPRRAFGTDRLSLRPCTVSGFTEGFLSGFSQLRPAWPCNHRAPGKAAVCFPGCVHRPCPRRQGAWGQRAEVHSIPDRSLCLNFALAPDGDIPWSCSVGFV